MSAHIPLKEFSSTCARLVREDDRMALMTVRQIAVLSFLVNIRAEVQFRDIAKSLNISKPVVTRVLDALERMDLATRRRDPLDRRNSLISPTDAALTLLLGAS